MRVNKKKPIKFKNRTNYFVPDSTRVRVTVSSPDSYYSRKQKIEGYESRLYWQYRYCESKDGQTFYYTLTYNDKAIPKHYGMNCFDYEDLRDLLTGGFRKMLLRKYGTSFKYFIGAELGDGKGVRGMHNNPHYHVLFFLEPSPFQFKKVEYIDVQDGVYQRSSKFHKKGDVRFKKERKELIVDVPYTKISPEQFRHLVREYWQGFDEDVEGYRPYNDSKYGIAHEGLNCGLVDSFRACMYCAKYVCKDLKLRENEDVVLRTSRCKHFNNAKRDDKTYEDFFHDVLYPMYNTPLNVKKTEWCFNDIQLLDLLLPSAFQKQKELIPDWKDSIHVLYKPYVMQIIKNEHLWDKFNHFVNSRIQVNVDADLNEWRNRFCNKCRISQGVGDFAIEHIEDKLNPYVQVPSKDGFKNRPIGMHYYRKMYCDVVKDKKTCNNLYVLNEQGIAYKLAQLDSKIQKMADKAVNNINLVLSSSELYEKMRCSDVNTLVTFTFRDFKRKVERVSSDLSINEICMRYAEFKLVYEDRFFEISNTGDSDVSYFPSICLHSDYARFLKPSFFSVSRNDLLFDLFLENIPQNFLPYNSHPYFLRYIGIFNVLDLCADYFFVQKDDKEQKDAEECARVKRFHDSLKLQQFYSHFK